MKNRISVCIPVSKMENGEEFLTRCLDSLWEQTMQDFEVIVSDNSTDDKLLNICQFYGGVNYQRNPIKGMAQNTNHAMQRAEGELIKILYMDDYLAHPQALENIWTAFEGQWLVTGCIHLKDGSLQDMHRPSYDQEIHLGKNTIGSPSVLTIKNENILLFDEEMTWLLDCDYYKRMYDLYGDPILLYDTGVVIGVGDHQATNTMGEEKKIQEFQYITQKYA